MTRLDGYSIITAFFMAWLVAALPQALLILSKHQWENPWSAPSVPAGGRTASLQSRVHGEARATTASSHF